jgi:hypothetical protein
MAALTEKKEEADPTARAGRFSRQAQETAELIGAHDFLVRMAELEAEPSTQNQLTMLNLLEIRRQLSDRILLGFLDVARTASEADCEEERADQLADRLQAIREKRVRYLTLTAIVGDALVGILSGALSLAAQQTAAAAGAIGGGALATGFGTAALLTDTEQEFGHARNILREVWEAPAEPSLIPTSVWRHLNRPLPDDPQSRSLRETLITRWRRDGRLAEAGSPAEGRRIELFFGEGGSYTIEDLRARAAMLDLLEADINLMSQDLEGLLQEVLEARLR